MLFGHSIFFSLKYNDQNIFLSHLYYFRDKSARKNEVMYNFHGTVFENLGKIQENSTKIQENSTESTRDYLQRHLDISDLVKRLIVSVSKLKYF